ncbi:hypothetical protein KEM54_004928 [Ascosphaera aggregata]|nr:hypothetical protein KEM54_004928 [Ascosphaera aggregata]
MPKRLLEEADNAEDVHIPKHSELWKRKYYSRWVWPRARRIQRSAWPNKTTSVSLRATFSYTPNTSQWLDHGHLSHRAPLPHWKQQYQLRHNWSRGACKVTQVEVVEKQDHPPARPAVQIKMCGGLIFTADREYGLRAWTGGDSMRCIAMFGLDQFGNDGDAHSSAAIPTALTAMTQSADARNYRVAVGLMFGKVVVMNLRREKEQFEYILSHQVGESDVLALALSHTHLATFTGNSDLSLFELYPGPEKHVDGKHHRAPRHITTLSTQSISQPVSLSMRSSSTGPITSIGYTTPRLGGGWTVGIQELRFDQTNERRLESRVATETKMASDAETSLSRVASTSPTSLSYSHPYLVTSHSDNTLTVYLVRSTRESLTIQAGRRLWGHTSAVRGVEVSERGKAVSVSLRGDDIRIWELEDVVSWPNGSKTALRREKSIQVADAETDGGGGSAGDMRGSVDRKRISEWIGFDEEQVVVLFGKEYGAQYLKRYSFA